MPRRGHDGSSLPKAKSEIFVDYVSGIPTLFISLSNSQRRAMASIEDHDSLAGKNFFISGGYAFYWDGEKSVPMHSLILPPREGKQVDHANRKRLDNTRDNLRYATPSENLANRFVYGVSGLKGVRKLPSGNYRVQVCSKGKLTNVGVYKHPIEAALLYDQWARQVHGRFAATNFPRMTVSRFSHFTI